MLSNAEIYNCLCSNNRLSCGLCKSCIKIKRYTNSDVTYYGMYLIDIQIWKKIFGGTWLLSIRKAEWIQCYNWWFQFIDKVDKDTVRVLVFLCYTPEEPSLSVLLDSKLLREDIE